MANKKRPLIGSIEEYLAPLDPEKAAALQALRQIIRAAAPAAEECISYGMPGFRLRGKLLVTFGAGENHCAFYPGSVVNAYAAELSAFTLGRGTIRFQPDRPIPAKLVEALVRARIARISGGTARPAAARRRSAPSKPSS